MRSKLPAPPAGQQRVRILLVDDHPLVRERLTEIINREADLMVCGEAEDRHEALAAITAKQPDLAIIDLALKNSDGLELIKDIRPRWPALRMLVVSMHDESLYAERVIRAHAENPAVERPSAGVIIGEPDGDGAGPANVQDRRRIATGDVVRAVTNRECVAGADRFLETAGHDRTRLGGRRPGPGACRRRRR